MFEKLVESFVVEYFSEWIEGLDAENMKVALFGGKVEFRELQLRASTIDKLQLPIRLKRGSIGRLVIKVPWKRLTSHAIKIQVQELFLLLVPTHQAHLQHGEMDAYAARLRWAKQQAIHVRELLEKTKSEDDTMSSSGSNNNLNGNLNGDSPQAMAGGATNNENSETSGSAGGAGGTGPWSYRDKIWHNMADNICFEFSQIHIRYEDSSQMISSNPLAMGFTIDSFCINTTNANGHVTFIDRSQSHTPFVHKSLDLHQFGVYCDNDSMSFLQYFSKDSAFAKKPKDPDMYILKPFNANVKLTINHDESTINSVPRYQFIVDISSLQAFVTSDQCKDILCVINFFGSHENYLKRIHCHSKRPSCPIAVDPKRWWQYAFYSAKIMYALNKQSHGVLAQTANNTLHLNPVKCTWKRFGTLWLQRSEYIRLYKRLLHAANKKLAIDAVAQDRERLREMEDFLDVESVVFFRLCAVQEYDLEETRQDSVKKLTNWKKRWGFRTSTGGHGAGSGVATGSRGPKDDHQSSGVGRITRHLDPLEKLLVYTSVNDQLHSSRDALAKAIEANAKRDAQSILFAIDLAVESVSLDLVEIDPNGSKPQTAAGPSIEDEDSHRYTRFVTFGMEKMSWTVFERSSGRTMRCSIQNVIVLDYSRVKKHGDKPEPMFLALAHVAAPSDTSSPSSSSLTISDQDAVELASSEGTSSSTSSITPSFVVFGLESDPKKLKVDCEFQPFRFIYNLGVIEKIQSYVVVPSAIEDTVAHSMDDETEEEEGDLSVPPSAASENKQRRLVSKSSFWLNKATSVPESGSASSTKPIVEFTIECRIRMPLIDLWFLSSVTSPILQATFTEIQLTSGQHGDSFVFGIEGIELVFIEALLSAESARHSPRSSRRTSTYAVSLRKHSRILKKTQFVFDGRKCHPKSKSTAPKWEMRCRGPPIAFHLSLRQFQQVMTAYSTWGEGTSNNRLRRSSSAVSPAPSPPKDPAPAVPMAQAQGSAPEFHADCELFMVSIEIPSIDLVLAGEKKKRAASNPTGAHDPSSLDGPNAPQSPNASRVSVESPELTPIHMAMLEWFKSTDVVLSIQQANLDAKFSSVAFATILEWESLCLTKKPACASRGTRSSSTDASFGAESMPTMPTTDETTKPLQPMDHAFDANDQPVSKLLEMRSKARLYISSFTPFKARLKAAQVALYWDQVFFHHFFCVYILNDLTTLKTTTTTNDSNTNTADAKSAAAHAPIDRLLALKSFRVFREQNDPLTQPKPNAVAASDTISQPITRYGIDLTIDQWFVFFRPTVAPIEDTADPQLRTFALELYGKGITANLSTLTSDYMIAQVQLKPGVSLDSRSVWLDSNQQREERVTELLRVHGAMSIGYESGGFADLSHRDNASSYLSISSSQMQVNYVHGYMRLFINSFTNDVLGLIGFINDRLKPPEQINPTNLRTKVDAKIQDFTCYFPRGAVNSHDPSTHVRDERLQLDVKQLQVSSRAFPADKRFEQLLIMLHEMQLSSWAGSWLVKNPMMSRKETIAQQPQVLVEFASALSPALTSSKKPKQSESEDEFRPSCNYVRVSIPRVKQNQKHGSPSSQLQLPVQAQPASPPQQTVNVHLNDYQYELIHCILDENFAQTVLDSGSDDAAMVTGTSAEYQVMHVEILAGQLLLKLYERLTAEQESSDALTDACGSKSVKKKAPQRFICKASFDNATCYMDDFSSMRSQYRAHCSKSKFWRAIPLGSVVTSSDKKPQLVFVPCAEVFLGQHDQAKGIDLTMDQRAPSTTQVSEGGLAAGRDIRVHIELSALSPSFIPMAQSISDLFLRKPDLPCFEPSPSRSLELSVTTGTVYCMMVQHLTSISSMSPNDIKSQSLLSSASMNLVLNGSVVLKYMVQDATSRHLQLFGRKMMLQVNSNWPPLACQKLSSSTVPQKGAASDQAPSSPALGGRVLCEDFGLDMDYVDTFLVNQTHKMSISLTHFHLVLCSFDVLLLTEISQNEAFATGDNHNSGEGFFANDAAALFPRDTEFTVGTSGTRGFIHINFLLEDASTTFVRETGDFFSPLMRMYSFCTMCHVVYEYPVVTEGASKSIPSMRSVSASAASFGVEFKLHFSHELASDEVAVGEDDFIRGDLEDDHQEGVSIWSFNSLLGAWEPILEPYTFACTLKHQVTHEAAIDTENEQTVSMKRSTQCLLHGNPNRSLNLNASPKLLETLLHVVKELEPLVYANTVPPVSHSSVISCGFYLMNDCGMPFSYWVSCDASPTNKNDTGSSSNRSNGFARTVAGYDLTSNALRMEHERVLPRQKVPLRFTRAIFPALPSDQTVSFSWGDDAWHPLTDVRIHRAGKFVYSILPKAGIKHPDSENPKDSDPISPAERLPSSGSAQASPITASTVLPKIMLALFDISAVHGYRTLTVSSTVQLFNDTELMLDYAVLCEDGKTVIELEPIAPYESCGVPINLIKSIASLRLLVRPHAVAASHGASTSATTASGERKKHRWSRELMLGEKQDSSDTITSCSLLLDDYDCKCQRIMDSSLPLHFNNPCASNGSFLRVETRLFMSSNAMCLKYAQVRVSPPICFENKCSLALNVVVFVFKQGRNIGGASAGRTTTRGSDNSSNPESDHGNNLRQCFHLVASQRIEPHATMQFFNSSLHDPTYCAFSLTGFNWTRLMQLPGAPNAASSSSDGTSGTSQSNSFSKSSGSPRALSKASAIVCGMDDFQGRKATVRVSLSSSASTKGAPSSNGHKIIVQPRFILQNHSSLALEFEPSVRNRSMMGKLPATPKALLDALSPSASPVGSPRASSSASSTPSNPTKPSSTSNCCGSPQLEMLHTKLNATTQEMMSQSSMPRSTTSALSQTTRLPPTMEQQRGHSEDDEKQCYYYTESNTINVQIRGNTMPSSGVSRFQLDTLGVGGSNSTLRVLDEKRQEWFDLVVIVEQIDTFCTRIVFVERFVFVNRTQNRLLCAACEENPLESASLLAKASVKQHQSKHKFPQPKDDPGCVTSSGFSVIEPRDAMSCFHFRQSSQLPPDLCVRLKIQDPSTTGWRWGGKFSLNQVSETALKMSNKFTGQVYVVRVEVRVKNAVRVFVFVHDEEVTSFPLYRIVNTCASEMVHFRQDFDGIALATASGSSNNLSRGMANSPGAVESSSMDFNRGVTQRLFPGESCSFGWDEAFFINGMPRVLMFSFYGESVAQKISMDQPFDSVRVVIPATRTKEESEVVIHWYLNGVTKTIHLHDSVLTREKLLLKSPNKTQMKKRKGSPFRLSSQRHGVNTSGLTVDEFALGVQIPRTMLSMLNATPEEVVLVTIDQLQVDYTNKKDQNDQLEIKVGSLQIDNQLENAVFPVMFTPLPQASSDALSSVESSASMPGLELVTPKQLFFHLSLFRVNYSDGVEYIRYFSAMLQPTRLQLDDFLVVSIASLWGDLQDVTTAFQASRRTSSMSMAKRTASQSSSTTPGLFAIRQAIHQVLQERMYIETLQLHPVKLQFSFQQNNLNKASFYAEQSVLLPSVCWFLKTNLANIDGAGINLNALHVFNSFSSWEFLLSAMQQHYSFQGMWQLYALIGSAEALGNPLGLVSNLGTGVKDFFYEPAAGMVKSPQDFVLGLSRGTASLVKNSVYGTFNAASKLTGTISTGLAALSMDSQYITQRNTRNRQEVATNVGTGLYYGTKQFGKGIFEGFSGVLTAPAMGAYQGGLTGFVEGVGKGLLGVAVKPTAGLLDLASKATAGITASATAFDRKARNTRMRLPRMMVYSSDKRLKVYSNEEAEISELLHKLPDSLESNEHYESHVFIPQNRVLIASSHHLFHVDFSTFMRVNNEASDPRIRWKYPLQNVWSAQRVTKGVNIIIGSMVTVDGQVAKQVTKSTMLNLLVPLRESDPQVVADRIVDFVTALVTRERERMVVSETFSSPPPRNSIGLVLEPVPKGHVSSAECEGKGGGLVVDVVVGSVCHRAGLQVNDVVLGFGNQRFEAGDHGNSLRTRLSLMKRGEPLDLCVLRDGQIQTIQLVTE